MIPKWKRVVLAVMGLDGLAHEVQKLTMPCTVTIQEVGPVVVSSGMEHKELDPIDGVAATEYKYAERAVVRVRIQSQNDDDDEVIPLHIGDTLHVSVSSAVLKDCLVGTLS